MPAVVTASRLDEINEILLEHNPFSQPPFVTANNVWGKGFPDVEGLNSHASDAVFKALEEIQAGKLSTASILITAQDGTGKSHVISRIRHHLQDVGGAFFILANKFSDLNQVKSGFQLLLAESLANIGSQGVKQWQELATAMTNDVRKAQKPEAATVEAKDLVKWFENEDEGKLQKLIQTLTKGFCKLTTVQDPDIIRAIFWTLSDEQSAYASNWLGGKEIAQYKANELRLPTQSQSFDTVLQILDTISEYNSLAICFDEMDLAEFNEAGLRKAQVISNLVKELVENLKRGVILSVMMPGIWKDQIQANMPAAISTKMTTYTSPLDLQYLDGSTTVELVSFFLQDYYEARDITPPHRVYPFDESKLREIGSGKPTVREVLKWCRENCRPIVNQPDRTKLLPPPPETDPVELAFLAEMGDDFTNSLAESSLITDALLFSFSNLIGETVEGVTISDVTTAFGKRGGKEPYLSFKIIGQDGDKALGIAVSVVQEDSGKFLGAALKKLLAPARFGLTRGCLVRSPEKPVSRHLKTRYLEPLAQKGGEFVKLYACEIKPLFALKMVRDKAASDYKVSDEEIQQFIKGYGKQYQLGKFNPMLCEILSDPSYQTPQDLIDEPEVAESALESNQAAMDDETDDSDVLAGLGA
jgi:hypothetical protein